MKFQVEITGTVTVNGQTFELSSHRNIMWAHRWMNAYIQALEYAEVCSIREQTMATRVEAAQTSDGNATAGNVAVQPHPALRQPAPPKYPTNAKTLRQYLTEVLEVNPSGMHLLDIMDAISARGWTTGAKDPKHFVRTMLYMKQEFMKLNNGMWTLTKNAPRSAVDPVKTESLPNGLSIFESANRLASGTVLVKGALPTLSEIAARREL